MASSLSLGARKNVNCNLLTGSVRIFQIEKFNAKFRILSINKTEFVKWVVEADFASSQEDVDVLRTKMPAQKANIPASIFAVTNPPLLRDAGTEQFCQVPMASKAVQTYAASDERRSEWLSTPLAQKTVFSKALEWEEVLAERFFKEERSRQEHFSAIHLDDYGTVASFSHY